MTRNPPHDKAARKNSQQLNNIPNGDPVGNIRDAALEWSARNELLTSDEFRSLVVKITEEEGGGDYNGQKLAIQGAPEDLGKLAADYDIGVAEIADEVDMGHLRGIRVKDGKVAPVLVCINHTIYQRIGAAFEQVINEAQPDDGRGLPIADGAGLESPSHTEGVPPENITDENRWFCMRMYNGQKVPVAPWIDENPEGEPTSWDQPVGHNWPGVKVGYETAKDWESKIDDWFLATRIDGYDEKSTPRLHLLDFDNVRDPDTGEVHPQALSIIEELDSYAQVSYSGTGIHAYVIGSVPEEYKETGFSGELGEWKHQEKYEDPPEIEGYAQKRFIAITEQHIDRTPTAVEEREDALHRIYEEFGEEDDGEEPDEYEPTHEREPDHTKTEVRGTETTSDWDVIFDAIAHAEPRFDHGSVELRSGVTNERSSGIYDIDPSWEHSDSGSRLGYDDGFIYRKSDTGLDILQVVALEERIITSVTEYPTGEDFHEAVEQLRKRGAHIPEYDSEADARQAVGTLPLALLDSLSHHERRRYARKRGIEWPEVESVRTRLRDTILNSLTEEDYTVKSAPTGSGKTFTVATEPWKARTEYTDNQPVVHAHRTREARDQARRESDDADVDAYTLKGRKELCPVAAGHYDPGNSSGNSELTIEGDPISEWIDHKCDRQGLPFSHAHRWAEEELSGDLPCQMGDEQCAALGQFEGIPRNEGGDPAYDVIHCTQQFLNVPSLRMHTHVFIDEKPAFGIDLDPNQVRESVNAYLDYINSPVDNYSELVTASQTRKDPGAPTAGNVGGITVAEHNASFREQMEDALNDTNERVECEECDGEGHHHTQENTIGDGEPTCNNCNGTGTVIENRGEPPLDWYRNTPEAHALAPAFTRAVWRAEDTAGNRKAARVPHSPPRWGSENHDEDGWNRVYVDVVLNDQYEVVDVEAIPDFTLTNTVVGLDAHPQPADPFWLANVHADMTTDYTLSTEERTLYRRYERGLYTVQIGEGVQPVTTGEWLDDGQGDKFTAIIQQLHENYGDEFDSAITSMSAKPFVQEQMQEAGIAEPEMMHYGEEESRNDFAGKSVGLVVGSIDPGDKMVIDLCARLGYDADPCYKECPVCEGTGDVETVDGDEEWCETCNGSGEVRERGRTFEGEDADQADAVLKGIREHHVAQSAGRWARNAEDDDDHAIVFIVTEAAPAGFIDAQVPGVTWATNEGQRERLEYVREQEDGVTAREVADACGCTKRTASRTLEKARKKGILEYTPGAGPYGAHLYWTGEEFNPYGDVDVKTKPDEATAEKKPRQDPYRNDSTYIVAVEARPDVAFNDPPDEQGDWQYQATFEWFEVGVDPPS